jgi:hypothetical protein
MNSGRAKHTQRGAITIFLSMMMLIFMTLMVITAYSLSSVSLQSVGNTQVRQEAVAAAQSILELVVASPFINDPANAVLVGEGVDINGDDVDDYFVDLAEPVCVRYTRANSAVGASVTLPGMSAVDAWNTVWDLDATATDPVTGASVRVRQGVVKLLTDDQKNLLCS